MISLHEMLILFVGGQSEWKSSTELRVYLETKMRQAAKCYSGSVYQATYMGFPGGWVVKNPPANAEDLGYIPDSGKSPGEGNGNPFPVFLPGKPTDRGAWWAAVHGVAK